jgi:hypothetical protein
VKRLHRRNPDADTRVVYDPTGDFAGRLTHVKATLRLGYFPPGMIVAQAGKQYVVQGALGQPQELVRTSGWIAAGR